MSELLTKLQNFSYKSDEEYRGDMTAISSHFLMSFLGNRFEKRDAYGYTPYFAQGHLLETLIFKDNHEDALYNEFEILDFEPSPTLQTLISLYAGSSPAHNFKTREEQTAELLSIIKENELWKSTKKENLLLDKFNNDEFWQYLDNLLSDTPRQTLSTDQYNIIVEAAERIKSMPFMVDLRKDVGAGKAHYFIHPMYKLQLTVEGFEFTAKAQYDMIVYYPEKNRLVIVDFKTTSDAAGNFGFAYKKYKYYMQSYWYYRILEHLFPNVDIEFHFAVVSKTHREERALLIEDTIVSQVNYPLFDAPSLFYNLNKAINVKGMTTESFVGKSDTPMALLNNFELSIEELL